MIAPMKAGNALATFKHHLPNNDAKAFSLFMIHYFKFFSFLRGGLPAVPAPPPPGSNASSRTPTDIPMAIRMEAIVTPCSRKSIPIVSANDVSLSNTLAIVPLKLVIWLVSLLFRRSMI